MKSTTVKWNPPTAEELPCNWSVQAMRYAPASYGDDGGAYKSRDGLIVIISCSMATPRLTPTHSGILGIAAVLRFWVWVWV